MRAAARPISPPKRAAIPEGATLEFLQAQQERRQREAEVQEAANRVAFLKVRRIRTYRSVCFILIVGRIVRLV
jgi:hypothetical protein